MKKIVLAITLLLIIVQNSDAQDVSVFRDKYAFKTAAEMYAVADTLPFDSKASELIKLIDRRIKDYTLIEHSSVWNQLVKLEPYRKSRQVQEAVARWTKSCKILKIEKFPKVTNSILYKRGALDTLIQQYRASLLYGSEFNKPTFFLSMIDREYEFALRNNLALVLMHKNMDLCAQIELEIVYLQNANYVEAERLSVPLDSVTSFEQVYLPAMINLTVVYERLGMTDKARLLAQKLHEYNDTDPMTNFNAAWYFDPAAEGRSSEISLRALREIQDEKYQLMTRKMNVELPWYHAGLIRKFGVINRFGHLGGYAVLLIFSLIIWYFYYRLLARYYHVLPLIHTGSQFGCLAGIAVGGVILIVWNFENAGILYGIFFLILLLVAFYPIIFNGLWSFLLYLLLMGGSRAYNEAELHHYLTWSIIVGIVIMLLARRANKRRYALGSY
jgi:hypothetical protein